jgi:hypothetical protein
MCINICVEHMCKLKSDILAPEITSRGFFNAKYLWRKSQPLN